MLHVTCLLGTGHPRSSFASSNRNCKKKKLGSRKKTEKKDGIIGFQKDRTHQR